MKEGWVPGAVKLHELAWQDSVQGARETPVVLLHGLTGCADLWDEVAERLARRGYWCLALDLRGHGLTEAPASGYTAENLALDVQRLLDHHAIERAHIVGSSVGCRVAWTFACLYPDRVGRLVAEDNRPDPADAEPDDWLRSLASWPRRFETRDEGLAFLRAAGRSERWYGASLRYRAGDGWTWAFSLRAIEAIRQSVLRRDYWPVLSRVRASTLLVRGEESEHLSHRTAVCMAEYLPAARLVEVPGADHWVHGRQPGAFADAVASFLTEKSSAT